ncbi:MAG: AAA family ATPase, partial [Acidobacteriota bacterium]
MTRPISTSPASLRRGDPGQAATPSLLDDRFEIIERLSPDPPATGALGKSYRAFDKQRARPVIVRTLEDVDAVTLYHLREPVARLRQIFHESLAPILEAQLVGDAPFWIREDVGGEPFDRAFRRAIEGGEDLRAARWVGQVLEGLDWLARFGLCHGHLTTENVRAVDGRVVLIDYALRGADGSDDLGQLVNLLARQIAAVEGASEPWRRLAASGAAESARSLLRRTIDSFGAPAAASPLLLDRPFVGREAELKRIHRAVLRTRRGASMTLLLEGPPGIGRSALLARSKRLVESQHPEALVLGAACQRPTRPGGALEALLEDLLEHLGRLQPREVEVVLPARPRELVFEFPLFLRLESVARATPACEERGESRRDRSLAALRQLFDRVAERRPLVLILDGAERADARSLDVLQQVLQPPDPPPLLLLIGLDQRAPRTPALDSLIAPSHVKTSSSKVERMTLQPLS